MMTTSRYTPANKDEWNQFVRVSKNGTFLFERAYMDYHSDRFTDHSLMIRDEQGKLVALLPANEVGDVLWSHQGLTYGGLVLSASVHTAEVGRIFVSMHHYMHNNGLHQLCYKPVPTIYHRLPSEEDEYWLWRYDACLEVCNIAATVNLQAERIPIGKSRRSNRNKLVREGFTINREASLDDFWPILTDNLMSTYNAAPVHTLDEMQRLRACFPDNILCWTISSPEGEVMGGMVMYVCGATVHTQYISASATGKQMKVLDCLLFEAVDYFRNQEEYRYFDFGTSNENGGRYLNETLIEQKEGFGGRGVTYKCYRLIWK